jgi:hypothetical protein
MKALHSITTETEIDRTLLTAAARLLQLYPNMRFRLTEVPYDYEHNWGGVPVQYFHMDSWTDWTTESIHNWGTAAGLGRRRVEEADIDAVRERFQ